MSEEYDMGTTNYHTHKISPSTCS